MSGELVPSGHAVRWRLPHSSATDVARAGERRSRHTARVSIRSLVLFAASLVALTAIGSEARAAPPLSVAAPRGCPGARELERSVSEHVGRTVSLEGVWVTVAREGATWRASLRTTDGERVLDAESCAAALEAVALVLALAVESEPSEGRPIIPAPPTRSSSDVRSVRAVPAAVTEASAAKLDVEPREPPVSRARRSSPALVLGAGVLAEVGLLPAPSFGARLGFGAVWSAWRLELAALALLPRGAELRAGGERLTARIAWWAGQLSGCRALLDTFEGCVGVELGTLRGEGSRVGSPRSAHGAWVGGTLTAVWTVAWSAPWSWQLGAGAGVAAVRPEFGFDGAGVLHRPSPVSGRLWLALDWR